MLPIRASLFAATLVLLAGCGGGGGGTPGPGPGPAPTTNRVINTSGIGAPNITIVFYNAAGTEVGRRVTTANGGFAGGVPATARTFDVLLNQAQRDFYYNQFGYGSSSFSSEICPKQARVPVVGGNAQTITDAIVLTVRSTSEAPPEPPTCNF